MEIGFILPLIGVALSLIGIGISVYHRTQNKKRIAEVQAMLTSLNATIVTMKKGVFENVSPHDLEMLSMEVAHLEEMLNLNKNNDDWWRKFNTEKVSSIERTIDTYIRGIGYEEEEKKVVNGGELAKILEFKKRENK